MIKHTQTICWKGLISEHNIVIVYNWCIDFFGQSIAFNGFRLIRKIRLNSKFMTSQPGLQTIAIHILPNIS